MIKMIDILDEKEKILHEKSVDVEFPLDKNDKKVIKNMLEFLKASQDEKKAEKYNLRPGMGLSAIQLGIKKRYFTVALEREDGFEEYTIINPKIISNSEELIYVGGGEGCLSVNREVQGVVPRHARITVSYQNEKGEQKEIRVREEIAVAFQHEIDHLNGILFVDKIEPLSVLESKQVMRMI